ncbi:putative ferric-chelate reductase 1 [Takifugu flavidus]|uniref:Putative ferric-chelate reductase 1 n=1 Tax=Takifugu flavidus TaxID=433684 RepID=A0A5C6P0M2_9TELE|nr:putative ferric-chelate reductase 1 [Takifugu flavidus]
MSPVAVPCLLLISILGFQCVPIFCYSNGKVSKVCGSMVPHHSGHGQTSPSPYHLQTNTTTFSPNDRIQVILSGSSPFEGFLLQARDAASPHSAATIGTFTLTNPGMTQLLTCNSHQSVRFELSGPAEGYVAFALSWDTMMADLSAVSWRLADGSMQCRFSRLVKMSSPETRRFSLDQEYFLFLANGHAQHALSDFLQPFRCDIRKNSYDIFFSPQGKIWKHNRQPLISTEKKLIIGPPEVLRGSRGPTLLKIHGKFAKDNRRFSCSGALMLLAWMVTGSVGTVIASFYKPDWPHKTLFGQKVWFQLHRGLMMLTVTLTIAAFCLPFFYRKGWSKGPIIKLSILALLALGNVGLLVTLLIAIVEI